MATYAITDVAIVLKPEDDVAIAKKEIPAGTVLEDAGGRIEVRQDIKPGHKVARRARRTGEAVRRYGQPIGFATADIAAGDHVHTQNVAVGDRHQEYEVGTDVQPVVFYPPEQMRYFDGYLREDGRVGTRNYVAIISGVNCSASVSQFVKDKFRDVTRDYPKIDGVLAITHKSGCGTKLFGEDHMALQRVLAGYAKHPNLAAYILIGLGCEVNQAAVMVDRQRMAAPGQPERKPFVVNIQEAGGIRKTVETAVREVAKLLPLASAAQRTKQPVSEITLATNCGGSDGASGITANPALGWAVDELVRYGGAGVLAETPEIYGAEHLLIRRAINEGVAKKLIDRYKWWEWYCRGIEAMDNNPAPGNKAGGITTVYEKSLGGVTKGGTTPMMDVFQYGEPITTRGFVFMDTPGHDPVSITGLVAGGCNIICSTTGRGSVFGCKPVPSIKLATNSLMYRHMAEDMDINCGVVLEGTPLPMVGRRHQRVREHRERETQRPGGRRHRPILFGDLASHRERGTRVSRDLLFDEGGGLKDPEPGSRHLLTRDSHGERHDHRENRRPAHAGHPRRGHEGQREGEGGEHREGVEEDAAVGVGHQPGRVQGHADASVEHAARQNQHAAPREASEGIHLRRDQHAAKRADRGAEEGEKVGRAPEGHVDAEEPVPEVVDRRRQDDEDEPQDRQAESTSGCDSLPPLERENAATEDAPTDDARVDHEVRGDPERVAPDRQVPLG